MNLKLYVIYVLMIISGIFTLSILVSCQVSGNSQANSNITNNGLNNNVTNIVTYINGGGIPLTDYSYVIKPISNIVTFPVFPTKSGYIFSGWFTESNGNGSKFLTNTTVISDITVYALWGSYTYTVTFNSEGGSAEPSQTVISPATTLSSLPTPTTNDQNTSFDAWYTQPDGNGDQFTTSTLVTSNITVYANWISGSGPANGGGND